MAITQVVAVRASDASKYSSVPPNASADAGGNGGAAARRGSGSSLLDDVAVSRSNTTVFASTVVDGDHADKVISGGVFAGNNAEFIGKRLTDTLAGNQANTILLSGAAVPKNVKSIHKLNTLRTQQTTMALRANKWNEVTGEWDAGYPENSTDTLATDNAANPNRTTPGRLSYKTSAPLPKDDVYKAKNG